MYNEVSLDFRQGQIFVTFWPLVTYLCKFIVLDANYPVDPPVTNILSGHLPLYDEYIRSYHQLYFP